MVVATWMSIQWGTMSQALAAFATLVVGFVAAVWNPRRDRRRIQAAQEAADLDETRRLLYMVLLAADSTSNASASLKISVELAGTLYNALAHHSELLTSAEAYDLSYNASRRGQHV